MSKNTSLTHDIGLLWLRALAGLGMMYHGYGKVFGGHMPQLIEGVKGMGFPMPEFFAWAAALSEFVGGLLLILGFLTRISAGLIFITMTVAAFIVHKADPLQAKELAFAYWVVAAAIILIGPGKFSIDQYISKR